MAVSGIYKITSPSGKIYIGQSNNIDRRMIEHKYRAKNKNCKLYASIRKHGFDNHNIETLFISDNLYEKNKMESIYIRYYNTINDGLNHINEDANLNGFLGKKHSIENVNKIRERMNGVTPTWAIDKVKKSVFCEHTNKSYDSISECAKDLNISQASASMQYSGKRNNKFGIR
jgi:group I intron endonuclease